MTDRPREPSAGPGLSSHDLFDRHPQPMWIQDATTRRFLAVNEAAVGRYGYSVTEFLAMSIDDILVADGRASLQDETGMGGDAGVRQHRLKSGQRRVVEATVRGLDFDGRPAQLVMIQDITDRQRAETAERLHAAESRALEMISTGAPLASVLDQIVCATEEMSPDAIGSILLLDPDGCSIRHGAAPHLPESYNRALDGLKIGPKVGSCGTAMYRREQVIVIDIEADPLWEDYRPLAREHGLCACWSTPILDAAGEVLASFAMYYREPRAPREIDHTLIGHVTHLARIAIKRTREAEALRASEERFRQLAENIGEVFWLVDLSPNRFLYVSPAYEVIWGQPVSGLYEDPAIWLQGIHEVDRPRVLDALTRRRSGGYNVEYRVIRPDGAIRWVADRGFPVRDGAGKVRRIAGAVRDITETKEAEQRLRESEQRFQAVADATADVVWDWDLAADTIWWSGDFESVFGYPVSELEPGPKSRIARAHSEDRTRVAKSLQEAIDSRSERWSEQYRFLHKDGRYLHIEDRGRIIVDAGGKAIRFIGGMRDVSEAHEAQERIRDLQQRLETLVSRAKIGILVHQDFKPVLANEELARLLGYDSAADVLRLADCRALFAEEEHERVAGYNRARLRGEDVPAFYSVKGRTRDGSVVVLENRAFPIAWEGRMSVCAMLVDVTDRIELEAKLRQSQRLEAVGQLTGGVAHDFNNLLTVILGNAELLVESLSDDQRLRLLAEMTRTAAERGADLTNRLLAFSRRQTLDPKATDVGRLMVGMDNLLRRTLGEHVEIEVVRGGGLWPAFVDAPQLENAILNLCINARDAMPKGGRLTIELANAHLDESYAGWNEEVRPGQYVLIAISDTGSGMAPDVLRRAFEPFFTTKDVGKGSGLGLSMVFGFAKQSNGHVKLYSEPGQGTTARLYLPRARAADALASVGRVGAALGGGSEKILLVEDHDLVRDHVADQLRSLGYHVVSVTNGPEALDALKQAEDFDLLFTDVVMPGGMSGRQLAEEASRVRPRLPVLFTSGYTENAIVHHGRLDPGVHLLNKPYRREELAKKVRRVLGGTDNLAG